MLLERKLLGLAKLGGRAELGGRRGPGTVLRPEEVVAGDEDFSHDDVSGAEVVVSVKSVIFMGASENLRPIIVRLEERSPYGS